jgi:hypothetical protein
MGVDSHLISIRRRDFDREINTSPRYITALNCVADAFLNLEASRNAGLIK